MWDPAALPTAVPPGDGLDGYDAFVQHLAARARDFGKNVLLINGDSHLFEGDRPLSAAFYANPATVGDVHGVGFPVESLRRVTVEGSCAGGMARLTIDRVARRLQLDQRRLRRDRHLFP